MKFRMRYVVGGALVLGIAAGVWLGDWFKGFGPGGDGTTGGLGTGDGVKTSLVGESPPELGVTAETTTVGLVTSMLRVVIKDRSYFLRDGETDTPIELPALVDAVKQHPADDDGIKLRLYRSNTARVTAELQLREALHAAGVSDAAIYVSPDAVE